MKFEYTEVMNFDGALRGMRNPLESWAKSDSYWQLKDPSKPYDRETNPDQYIIGPNDMGLAQRLIQAGPEHRKFMRQIFVCVDITAALYWYKEFDTYAVGVTKNSTSTMHKITSKPITLDCFEIDDYVSQLEIEDREYIESLKVDIYGTVDESLIPFLESLRLIYLKTKDKRVWKELIRWLPESWLQTRTITMTYENIYNMIRQRYNHKLNEWSGKDDWENDNFIKWAKTLPYADEMLFLGM